jgi:hypothetical protein
MQTSIDHILARAILPVRVRPAGHLTTPRSYGVYELHAGCGATRRFRFGNHPIRMREIALEFGRCSLLHLFLSRADAPRCS